MTGRRVRDRPLRSHERLGKRGKRGFTGIWRIGSLCKAETTMRLLSLSTARVETKPHQVDAALFALQSPLSKGVILTDEVGLGKTIEASLVFAQRWAERRRRVLF